MTRLKERFRGLYWRQMLVTMGTVLLTLALLGASYCALGYSFLRQERIGDMETRARVVARLSAGHLQGGSFADGAELAVLTGFAASVSDMNFLICDTQGRALLTSDETLSGRTVSIPESVMRQTLEKGVGTTRSDLDGSYSGKRLLVGVPITAADGTQAGAVFAVTLDGRFCGAAGCLKTERENTFGLFYQLLPEVWGRGIGTLSARMALERRESLTRFSMPNIGATFNWKAAGL